MFALVVAGIILLGVGGWMFRRSRQQSALGTALRSAPVLSCTEAAGQADRGPVTCQLSGATEPGPGGPLTAPLSGKPCVWFHVRVSVRKRGGDGLSYDRKAHQESSTAPFWLRDARGGVLVFPEGISADFVVPQRVNTGYPKTVERFEKQGSKHLIDLRAFGSIVGKDEVVGHLYEEWAIESPARVYVLGSARSQGREIQLGRPASGPFLLSVRDPGRQAQLAEASVGMSRTPALACAAVGAIMLIVGVVGIAVSAL